MRTTLTILLALALAAGCRTKDEPVDEDGDGFDVLTDCDDTNADVFPDADEVCNGVDDDCDGDIDEEATDAVTWYLDADSDGSGDAWETAQGCEAPSGYVADATDCDDRDADYHPGAPEDDCTDPNDYNCDGSVGYADADADGYPACEDCNDAVAKINPAATEVCDEVDNDCDGTVDGPDSVDADTFYADADADGFGDAATTAEDCEAPEGYVSDDTDCDDTVATTFPGADETCNLVDDDCDGDVDEDAIDASTWYLDYDGDGFGGTRLTLEACEQPASYVADASDCDDQDDSSYPGGTEVCDEADNDCNGTVDDDAIDADTWYADADADGYGDASTTTESCDEPSGYTDDATDCDDTDADVSPGDDEVCNEIDDDCDGIVDEDDAVDASTWYQDYDSDGYGDDRYTTTACEQPSGYAEEGGDCDDLEDAAWPGAEEYCDELDNDCDGTTDEDDALDAETWYADADGDGYGDADDSEVSCEAPSGYVDNAEDCDDTDSAISLDGDEDWWDEVDSDCDGDEEPDVCDELPTGTDIADDPTCTYALPSSSSWSITTEWTRRSFSSGSSYNNVMMTPVVGQLTDDNGDGAIDELDNPDVAFTTFYSSSYSSYGYLRLISGDTGAQILNKSSISVGGSSYSVYASGGVGIGDLENDGSPDVLVTVSGPRLAAMEADGTGKWVSGTINSQYNTPQIVDLDGDGDAEVLIGDRVLESDGSTRFTLAGGSHSDTGAADIDGDGELEVFNGYELYDPDGTLLWTSSLSVGHTAAGQFDTDNEFEIAVTYSSSGYRIGLLDDDGTTLWATGSLGSSYGYGAPCVADFDGDGDNEIAATVTNYMYMYDASGTRLWRYSHGRNSSVGCSAFDFDGDGAAELLFTDESDLYILDGATGSVLYSNGSYGSGTIYEMPVVADVDRDGEAEIVVAANDYHSGSWDGVRALGDANHGWANARLTFNQYSYVPSYTDDDSSCPSDPGASWDEGYGYRAQTSWSEEPDGAPDLAFYELGGCPDCSSATLDYYVAVDNQGGMFVPEGLELALYAVDGTTETLIEVATLEEPLHEGERSEPVHFEVDSADIGADGLKVVVDDDGTGAGSYDECDETNNTLTWDDWDC